MAGQETRAPMRRWAADMQMYPMYPIRLALVASILGAPLPTRTTAGAFGVMATSSSTSSHLSLSGDRAPHRADRDVCAAAIDGSGGSSHAELA